MAARLFLNKNFFHKTDNPGNLLQQYHEPACRSLVRAGETLNFEIKAFYNAEMIISNGAYSKEGNFFSRNMPVRGNS